MASRARQSTAQPTQRRTATELPTYQKPTFPLNPAAQRALAQLNHSHNLKKLDDTIQEAQVYLSNSAAAINDGLTERERVTMKRREQATQDAETGNSDELEQELEAARDKVDRMTQRMEESMRKMIDGRHSAQSISTALVSTADDARANASTQASTQTFQSQRPPRRPPGTEGEEDEDMNDADYQDFEPTDPTTNTQTRPSPLETFKSKVEDSKTRYQNYSFTERYANDNDYRNFRKVVHDAKYPDDEQPLPHHSEWFKEHDAPAPGITTRAREVAEGEDDDDIAVSRARISTKCPLTLMEFQTPLTSTKCPHSFEATAITQMISGSNNRVNPRGERYVQCPVPGCSQTLTRHDLVSDAVLIRKIKRIQRSKELEDEEMEGNDGANVGGHGSATVIEDDGDDVDDIIEDRAPTRTQLKKEATATPAPPASTARRGTASRAPVVEVGGESEEDEAEEGDTMVE